MCLVVQGLQPQQAARAAGANENNAAAAAAADAAAAGVALDSEAHSTAQAAGFAAGGKTRTRVAS
jgi:hypothetical protein